MTQQDFENWWEEKGQWLVGWSSFEERSNLRAISYATWAEVIRLMRAENDSR